MTRREAEKIWKQAGTVKSLISRVQIPTRKKPAVQVKASMGNIRRHGFVKFVIKDSGKRAEFPSGMVRDTGDKVRYNRCLEGPMFQRWADHLHKGFKKYPDIRPGVANWTLANTEEERQRYKESALGHMIDWLMGKRDEDHAAAVFFNINGAEYIRGGLENGSKKVKARAVTGAARKRRKR